MVRSNKIDPSTTNVSLANWWALCLLVCSFFVKSGTNAKFNAPSAKNLRNIFGRLNAIKKASASGPAPKRAAIVISLIKPRILLARVQTLTVRKFEFKPLRFMMTLFRIHNQ